MIIKNLSARFSLILLVVLLFGVIVSGLTLWQVLQERAQNDVAQRGLLLTETMNAVRGYTSNNVSPLLQDELAQSDTFISETVPAFSAREVFERFRQTEEYAHFFYVEATLNPMNPRNQADEFETALVEQMRSDAAITELTGYRERDGQQLFYLARPLAVGAESCLGCHASAESAPANLVATYGDDGGFGWQLNEIVAAQMIYVPAADVFNQARQSFILIVGIFAAVIATSVAAINLLLRRDVIRPVGVMGQVAQQLAGDRIEEAEAGAAGLERIAARPDELGQMARLFERMVREVVQRTRMLKEQIQSLRIEIDTLKKQEHVDEVTDSEFFRDLQERRRQMRGGEGNGDD
jgi:methyl-accepting chemotaxis protein